jgi:hypothetical protein
MYAYFSLALNWILFLALFPLSFFWLRRAWRIFIQKNYADVALKGGKAPAHQEKWALIVGLLNLVAGGACIWTIVGVAGAFYDYDTWSAIAGTTIWGKILADWIVRMQAHPFTFGKKKNNQAG